MSKLIYLDSTNRLRRFKYARRRFEPPLVVFENEIQVTRDRVREWVTNLNVSFIVPIIDAYVQETPPLGMCLPYLIAERDNKTLSTLSDLVFTMQIHASLIDDITWLAGGPTIFKNTVLIAALSYRIAQLFCKLEAMTRQRLAVHYEEKIPKIVDASLALAFPRMSVISPEHVLDIYRQRSTFVYSLACGLASRIVGDHEEQIRLASRFGEGIALAYCLLDDIEDLTADIGEKRLSYPICCMKSNQPIDLTDLDAVIDAIMTTAKVAISLSKSSIRYLKHQKRLRKKEYLIWLAREFIPARIENTAEVVTRKLRETIII